MEETEGAAGGESKKTSESGFAFGVGGVEGGVRCFASELSKETIATDLEEWLPLRGER